MSEVLTDLNLEKCNKESEVFGYNCHGSVTFIVDHRLRLPFVQLSMKQRGEKASKKIM